MFCHLGSEVFQQQDVQELTRVLFDALEQTFKVSLSTSLSISNMSQLIKFV